MEDNGKQIRNRSDEIQEILGTPPSWIVRWGTTAALISFCCLIFIGWVIRIPDVLTAEVTIKSSSEPVRIQIPPEDRNFTILVENGDSVRQGSWLVHSGDEADLAAVLRLTRSLDTMKNLSESALLKFSINRSLELGALQPDFTRFIQLFNDFKTRVESATGFQDATSLLEEINTINQSIDLEEERLRNRKKRLTTLNTLIGKLKEDYLSKKLSYEEYMKERSAVFDLENQINLIELGIKEKKQLLRKLEDRQLANRRKGDEAGKNRLSDFQVEIDMLGRKIRDWVLLHLIKAPVDGWVSYSAAYSKGKRYPNPGKEIMAVIPFRNGNALLEAEADLPQAGSGKVRPGQRVLIRLEGFPSEEFGFIEARVKGRPNYYGDEAFLALPLSLPQGLVTSSGKNIQYEYLMKGKCEIIVDEKRFLERLFNDFFSMIRLK